MNEPQVEASHLVGGEIPEEDLLRARFYGLLARLLSCRPSAETLGMIRALEGDETDIGQALAALSKAAAGISEEAAGDEYDALFVGVVKGELLPYASFYMTGFLHEEPLAELRGDMNKLGVARSDGVSEPEDHIAIICETMQGLILGTHYDPASLDEQKEFFDAHIAKWALRFFEDLEAAGNAALYMPVGKIGRLFLAIEAEAFRMTA